MTGQADVAGLRLAVVVGGSRLGEALAGDLEQAGAKVALITPVEGRATAAAAVAQAVEALGGLDAVIDAASLPESSHLTPIGEMTEAEWIERSEGPVRRQLWILQAAHPHLKQSRGRIVLVQPNFGISGMAGATALGAAVEGQRILAKVAARQWGPDGIAANVLAVGPELVLPGIDQALVRKMAEVATGFLPPSLRPVGSSEISRDVTPLVAFLASPAGGLVTGQTVIADGGSWMSAP